MPRSSSRLRRLIVAARRRREIACRNCQDPDRFGYLHTPTAPGVCRVTLPRTRTTYGVLPDGRQIVTQRVLRDGATIHVRIGPEEAS